MGPGSVTDNRRERVDGAAPPASIRSPDREQHRRVIAQEAFPQHRDVAVGVDVQAAGKPMPTGGLAPSSSPPAGLRESNRSSRVQTTVMSPSGARVTSGEGHGAVAVGAAETRTGEDRRGPLDILERSREGLAHQQREGQGSHENRSDKTTTHGIPPSLGGTHSVRADFVVAGSSRELFACRPVARPDWLGPHERHVAARRPGSQAEQARPGVSRSACWSAISSYRTTLELKCDGLSRSRWPLGRSHRV